ncbi:MAG TPA: nickel pincer cofactor biosynthesis protein LarC [Acidobacteriota bacterium]|nr:nickel pincer cofactor biosynthesis protein LarC [Acidobacteriota bacterium]
MKCLFVDGEAGAAGDMFLAALIDLGVSPARLSEAMAPALPDGFQLAVEPVSIHGIAAKKLRITLPPGGAHRRLSDVVSLLAKTDCAPSVQERAKAIFRRLAEAEARIHNATPEEVRFHEIGADDAILDVLGAAWGLAELGVEKVYCAPLVLGSGVGQSAHGPIHYPAPAVMEILRGRPIRHVTGLGETTTPTGAAILAEVAEFTEEVLFTPARIGYGAGTRTLPDRPNLLRATIGTSADIFETDRMWVGASDIDNTRPEVFEWLSERLRAVGAVDITLTDVAMKKGRPGVRVEVLCTGSGRAAAAAVLLSETASLGVRWTPVVRTKLPRHIETVTTAWGPIRVKVAELPDGGRRAVPEYDDCRAVAAQNGVPLITVFETVNQLYMNQGNDTSEE